MASLKLEHIYKVYPNGTKAVNDFSLEIKDKEFIVLVGPSGCGKSTTLRMIAGLEEISAGELYIGDTMVNDIEPKDRDIAMVFQNYALYPHMTVYENMAFGLTLRHIPRDIIHEKVMWAAEVLGLKDYLDRKPRAMSGGQRQRVALGRAILRNPKVMLLDEPLSNLDAKLRSQMRSEISKLHLKLQTTFIYVTHDQVEAMTLGTRVVVMKGGRIQQVDSPKNLYDYPANKFVAGFIGTPQMNFININLNRSGDTVNVKFLDADTSLDLPFNKLLKVNKNYLDGSKEVILGLRCENISLDPTEETKDNGIDVYVSHFEELGNETLIYAELDEKALGEMDSKTKLIVKADSSRGLNSGDKVKVYFDINKAHFFDKKTEKSISPRIPEENTLLCEITNNKITVAGATYDLPKVYDIASLKGDAIVPIKAVTLGETGDIKATITKVEKVDEETLVYLTSGNAVFFALGTGNEKVGETTYATFNFAKSTLIDDNGDKYEPLREYDVAMATFTNYRTAIAENPENVIFDNERNARMEVVRKEYDEKLAALQAEYDAKVSEVSALDNAKLNEENAKELAAFLEEYKAKVAESTANYKAEIARLKEESKTTLDTARNEINAFYENRIKEENEDFKKIITTNKDKEVIRSRKIEHSIFKENTPKEKQNDLDRKLNAISLEYDTLINAAKNTHNRLVNDLKTKRKELLAKIKYQKDYLKSVHKDYALKLKALEAEKEKAVTIAGLVFFYNVDDHFMIVPEKISNKVIQGLGNKVFTRTYRILVPHDGFILDEKGIEGEVISINDFGQYSYYLVKSTIHDEVNYFYFDASKYNLEIGQKVNYIFDFEKTQIFETSLNIRLY